jgi:hypothetical protein
MITHDLDEALKWRAMAARFRMLAAETEVEPYRHKFEDAAVDLEVAAMRAEIRPDLIRAS